MRHATLCYQAHSAIATVAEGPCPICQLPLIPHGEHGCCECCGGAFEAGPGRLMLGSCSVREQRPCEHWEALLQSDR